VAAVMAGVALAATSGRAAASAAVVLVQTQTPITAIDANSTWLGLRRDRRTLTAAPGCVTVIHHRGWTTGAITKSGARPRQVLAVRGKAVWFTTTQNRSRVLAAPLP
jgi:hypothetical protein